MPIDENDIVWDASPKIDESDIEWDKPAAKAEGKSTAEQPDAHLKGMFDVASSFGSGMAKGAVALPGLPGDIEKLGRMGLRKLGYNVDEETYFPRGEEFQEALKPSVPALNEKPETRPGKYAETIGEFAVMPASDTVKATAKVPSILPFRSVVAPAVASETAGWATEGKKGEPWARFGAAALAGRPWKKPLEASDFTKTVEAGNRAGVGVPSFVASEKDWPRYMASAVSNLPFTGVRNRAATMMEQLGAAAEKAHQEAGGLGAVQAGQTGKQAIIDWIKSGSKKLTGGNYDEVFSMIDKNVKVPTENLTAALEKMRAENIAAGLPENSKAMNLVMDAATRPEGLTFEGLKKLRTKIGGMMDNKLLPADMDASELKHLYGVLSDDLGRTVEVAGGPKAKSAYELANRINAAAEKRREALTKIVGPKGDATPEAVLGTITSMAQQGKSGDINRLVQARRSMSPDEWQGLTSGILETMGRDNAGEFSASRFSTAWNKLSDHGRDVLFGPPGSPSRQALDDIALLSSKTSDSLKEYANTSKTATNMVGLIPFLHPTYLPKLGITMPVGHILSSPKLAKKLATYERARVQARNERINPIQRERIMRAATLALQRDFNEDEAPREKRASGGKVGKRDYPAKKLTSLEKAAKRAFNDLATETRPIMDMPDEHVAQHLGAMSGE